jgi:hypothetical protein
MIFIAAVKAPKHPLRKKVSIFMLRSSNSLDNIVKVPIDYQTIK